jgi:hypothetical protein
MGGFHSQVATASLIFPVLTGKKARHRWHFHSKAMEIYLPRTRCSVLRFPAPQEIGCWKKGFSEGTQL